MEKTVLKEKKRVNVLGVLVDIVSSDELEERIESMLADGERHQLVFLDLWGLFRARGKSDFARSIRKASLVVPTSKIVVGVARFLGRKAPERFMPFDFIIRTLGILEMHHQSIYLLGSDPGSLNIAAGNLRASFPGLRIVGRCAGYFKRNAEANIILAIRKAAPSLILAGSGVKGGDAWLLTNMKSFAPGMSMWCGECFDIFSGKRQKPAREVWESGLYLIPVLFRNPFRIFRMIPYTFLFFVMLFYKIKRL